MLFQKCKRSRHNDKSHVDSKTLIKVQLKIIKGVYMYYKNFYNTYNPLFIKSSNHQIKKKENVINSNLAYFV